jgi:uncharacterized membrane protein
MSQKRRANAQKTIAQKTIVQEKIVQKTFRVGITLKGIDGALETFGGLWLWFIHPTTFNAIVSVLSKHEFKHSPQLLTAFHTLYASEALWYAHRRFASIYLLSHGLTKVILVIALWMNSMWAYPLTIFVFGGFSVYQMYRFSFTHSIPMLLLTIFDLAIIYLTWLQWRDEKANRAKSAR